MADAPNPDGQETYDDLDPNAETHDSDSDHMGWLKSDVGARRDEWIGRKVGQYEILRIIGTGGTVKAITRVLRRTVVTRQHLERLEEDVWVNGPPPELKPHRQPVFLPGLLLVERLMERAVARELQYMDLSVGKALLRKLLPYYQNGGLGNGETPSEILNAIHFSGVAP